MTNTDRIALEKAFWKCSEDVQRNKQLEAMCKHWSWEDAAKFAAALCQKQALQLKPWEAPPCRARDESTGWDGSLWDQSMPAALQLRQRMIAAGVSVFDPDPIGALKAAAKAAENARPRAKK